MNDDIGTQLLRRELDELAPTPDADARMRERLDGHVRRAQASRMATRHHNLRRLRAPRIAIGTVLAATAAIAFAFALAPGGKSPENDGYVGPTSAAARELVDAGRAAADGAWTPLRDGDLYHLYSSTWAPNGDQDASGSMGGGATTQESWLDRDGNGMQLIVVGASRLDRAPTTYRDPKTGQIRGTGSTRAVPGRQLSFEASMSKPDTVMQLVWPTDGSTPFQRGWVRTTDGYEQSYAYDQTESGPRRGPSADDRISMFWGLSINSLDEINEVPDSGLAAAVETVLDAGIDQRRSNMLPGSHFGATVAQIEREIKIESAVNLLGRAPVAPRVRRAIFEWLAKQPGATLDGRATDSIGRTGIQITFGSKWQEHVPARTVTAGELLREARAAGVEDIELDEPLRTRAWNTKRTARGMMLQHPENVPHDTEYDVPAHDEERTWSIELIVEPDSGELLQYASKTVERSSAAIPRLRRERDGALFVDYHAGGEFSGRSGGAQLVLARGRASSVQPQSPVCSSSPDLCSAKR